MKHIVVFLLMAPFATSCIHVSMGDIVNMNGRFFISQFFNAIFERNNLVAIIKDKGYEKTNHAHYHDGNNGLTCCCEICWQEHHRCL